MTTIQDTAPAPVVHLDAMAEYLAMQVGAFRRTQCRILGVSDVLVDAGGAAAFTNEAIGAAGELAVATWLGIPWEPPPWTQRKPGADLGTRTEVRTAAWRPDGRDVHLLIRPKDPIGRRWVFVVCRWPQFRLMGWIEDAAARREEWRRDPNDAGRSCFLVPTEALRPMAELRWVTL